MINNLILRTLQPEINSFEEFIHKKKSRAHFPLFFYLVFSDLNGQKLTVNNEDDEYTEPHGPNIERDLRHLSDFQYRQSLLNKTCFNNKI
jgi:hypothetical protein